MLHAPITDYRFSEFFLDLLPVPYALKVLEYQIAQDKIKYNALSTTNAFGWASLMSSFGGNKIDYRVLLPISEMDALVLKEGLNQPSERTLKMLADLLKQGRLPRSVKLALAGLGILAKLDSA